MNDRSDIRESSVSDHSGGPGAIAYHAVEVTVRHWNGAKEIREYVGGWPGYHTHWTPIPIPSEPKP